MSLWLKLRDSFATQIALVIGGLVAVALAGYTAGCWEFAQRAYASVARSEVNTTTITSIQSQQEEHVEKMYKRLDLILGEIQSVKKEQVSQNVLTGLAIRLDCCRGDKEPWVRVNALSPAIRFTEGEKLKVTIRTREEITEEMMVKGTFRAENPQYLLQLNAIASEILRVGRATEIGVMVRACNGE